MTKDTVLCFGELFIDMFAQHNKTGGEARTQFFQHAGGSPGIVAYALAGYGSKVNFIGKLSDDHFADYLVNYMKDQGVKMDYAIRSSQHRCTISFVRRDAKGEREFEIYRDSHYAADLAFTTNEWQPAWFSDAAILHCGSNCQVSEGAHLATLKGVQLAQQHNTLVSYDPNFRLSIWQDHQLMQERINSIIPYAQIIKMSDDEAAYLFPKLNEEQIAQRLFAMNCQIMLITRGGNGASAYHPQHPPLHLPAIRVDVVDTTGAGDNFNAAFIHKIMADGLLVTGIPQLSAAALAELTKFAHAGASLSVTSRGGMDSSPNEARVAELATQCK